MELRDAIAKQPDLVVLWVMADNQINERTRVFIDEYGLRKHVRFLSDESSALIQRLGILRPNPEPVEAGVPHPTTFVLDREGIVRFVDAREDFHIWLDPSLVIEALAAIP
ncbi:MAG: redoxin domain-containing protein [Proteobacteria bacterium]|nr:redoxin domain-containing protein [Pseudomonadota bacterium]